MVEGKKDAFTYKILKIIRNKNNCIIIRIQDFGQGGTRILGTKILSKFRNKKIENRYNICGRIGQTPYKE